MFRINYYEFRVTYSFGASPPTTSTACPAIAGVRLGVHAVAAAALRPQGAFLPASSTVLGIGLKIFTFILTQFTRWLHTVARIVCIRRTAEIPGTDMLR
jgi:hypothetical protein